MILHFQISIYSITCIYSNLKGKCIVIWFDSKNNCSTCVYFGTHYLKMHWLWNYAIGFFFMYDSGEWEWGIKWNSSHDFKNNVNQNDQRFYNPIIYLISIHTSYWTFWGKTDVACKKKSRTIRKRQNLKKTTTTNDPNQIWLD